LIVLPAFEDAGAEALIFLSRSASVVELLLSSASKLAAEGEKRISEATTIRIRFEKLGEYMQATFERTSDCAEGRSADGTTDSRNLGRGVMCDAKT
jgi:hypothetical protein